MQPDCHYHVLSTREDVPSIIWLSERNDWGLRLDELPIHSSVDDTNAIVVAWGDNVPFVVILYQIDFFLVQFLK